MSGIVEGLVDGAVASVEQKVPGVVAAWVEKAVESGSLQISKLPIVLQPLAQAALDRLNANRDVIGTVSQHAFVGIVSKLALGQGEQARLIYLGTAATFQEQMAALDEASVATRQEAADRNAAWEKAKEVAEEILAKLGAAAIPFLLAL